MDNFERKKSKYISRNISSKYIIEPYWENNKVYKMVVSIPVYNESKYLIDTIKSLKSNDKNCLSDTLVLLIINNPEKIDKNSEAYLSNQEILKLLRNNTFSSPNKFLSLKWIDASSPERGFPKKGGVGVARKLGMDAALNLLDWNRDPLIICLDADTIVEKNYLKEICLFFDENKTIPGATVSFKHLRSGDKILDKAIADYELFLHYYVDMLKKAGSPYAYHSIGSTIVVRAGDYIKAGGMRTHEAGEDFYFLQSLRKLGRILEISKTKVYQSSRVSDRVPFGTGSSVARLSISEIRLYNPNTFSVLKEFLDGVRNWINNYDVSNPKRLFDLIPDEAKYFLEVYEFIETWPKILNNTIKNNIEIIDKNSRKKLLWCFNIWFDSFRTLKFIHFLEREYPERFPKVRIDELKYY